MHRDRLWQALISHRMTGWRQPLDVSLPDVSTASRLLWCGIGGSLLPSEALVRALGDAHSHQRWISLASPEPMDLELQPDDQVVFASKSGKTLELWTWIGRLRSLPGWKALKRAPVVITQDDANPLAAYARSEGWTILPIPLNVGGRYSAFTPVGTFPLAWMGQDPAAFLEGAREVVTQVHDGTGVWGERVWSMVETLVDGYMQDIHEWVLIPYALRLETLTGWWTQLVAESLGKEAADGTRRGITPIRSVGPIDQHSQLQLWMAGPRRLGVIQLTVEQPKVLEALNVPAVCPYPQLAELEGTEILEAQAEGTREALEGAGVPLVHWHLEAPSSRSMGEFMMAWQLIVGLAGFAMELDPFDQPAVEDGKKRTFKKLGLA